MKRSLYIVSLLAFLATGCSNDAFEPLTDEFFLLQLVGTWTGSEVVATGCPDETKNGPTTCNTDECLVLTIDFDGSYFLVDNLETPTATESGTVDVDEETILFCPTDEPDCFNSNYILADETLTISFIDSESECNFTVIFSRQ